MLMARKKSWAEKRDAMHEVEVKTVPEGNRMLPTGGRMLIPNGRAIDAAIRSIPEGQTMTMPEVRVKLSQQYGADFTCPITTGIFVRIVTEAAYEAFNEGMPIEEVTPVWRVLDAGAPTLKKVSFSPDFILDQRLREAG